MVRSSLAVSLGENANNWTPCRSDTVLGFFINFILFEPSRRVLIVILTYRLKRWGSERFPALLKLRYFRQKKELRTNALNCHLSLVGCTGPALDLQWEKESGYARDATHQGSVHLHVCFTGPTGYLKPVNQLSKIHRFHVKIHQLWQPEGPFTLGPPSWPQSAQTWWSPCLLMRCDSVPTTLYYFHARRPWLQQFFIRFMFLFSL